MVLSVTSSYERKVQKSGIAKTGTLVGIIREQIKRNFSEGGRPKKWKKNTRATLNYKGKKGLSLRPNYATQEMRRIVIKGRIRTVKRKNKIDIKYIIPTSRSKNPSKFALANIKHSVQPFGNPNATKVEVPARPFAYVSRQAYSKLLRMATSYVEDIVMSMASVPGKNAKKTNIGDIEKALAKWADLKG